MTVVLIWRDTSGNWDENASNFPKIQNTNKKKEEELSAKLLRLHLNSWFIPNTAQAMWPTQVLEVPWSKRITCWVQETQFEVKMSVPHWVMMTSSRRVPSTLQQSRSNKIHEQKYRWNRFHTNLVSAEFNFALTILTAWSISLSLATNSPKLWCVRQVSRNFPRLCSA